MERDEEDNGRNEGTWRGTKLTMKLSWLSVCFLVMHSSCRQPFAHNNYNSTFNKMPNSSRWVLISVVLFLVHIVCSLTFMLIKIEMQCNAATQQDEKKIRRTSWWMNYYHEKIVILRRQVRPASVVMSSSPFKPLYPKQVILLAKTDGLSWVCNWIRSKKKSDAFVSLRWSCWFLLLGTIDSTSSFVSIMFMSFGALKLSSDEWRWTETDRPTVIETSWKIDSRW